MDPNATLREMRIHYANGRYQEAAELAIELDHWISRGGFLPDDWQPKK